MLITCPETGKPAYTGLNFDWITFDAMELGEQSFNCPACDQRHSWTKEDAYLRADGGGD